MFSRLPRTGRIFSSSALLLAGLLLAGGCQETKPPAPPAGGAAKGDADHDHAHHHSHGEKGPHGGALVALGDDAAHLEIVLDAESGKVTAYVLDGAAQNPVVIMAEKLELAFTREHDHGDEKGAAKKGEELPETGTLVLTPVEPAADGSTSVFAGESAELKGADEFDAVLTSVKIGEQEFKNVKFNYPEGNEHDHHHH